MRTNIRTYVRTHVRTYVAVPRVVGENILGVFLAVNRVVGKNILEFVFDFGSYRARMQR